MIALQDNDLDQAEQLYQDALIALQKIGDENCASRAIRDLGEIARRRGNYVQSAELLSQSLLIYIEMGNKVPIGVSLERFAALASSSGNVGLSVQLLAAAEQGIGDKINSSPILLSEHKILVSRNRDRLGREAFDQLWAAGSKLDIDEAAELALAEIRDSDQGS